MRFISRSLKLAAWLLAALLLLAAVAWATRHSWIPELVNRQLDGLVLTRIDGLHLSRSDHGIRADINRLTFNTDAQGAIDLEAIRVTQLAALIRALLNPLSETAQPESAVLIARLIITPGDSSAEAKKNKGSSAPEEQIQEDTAQDKVTAAPRPDEAPGEKHTETVGISIGSSLNRLRQLPIQSLTIDAIHWPDTLPGRFALTATQSDRGRISGALTSDRCPTCRLDLQIQSASLPADISLKLQENSTSVARLEARIRPGDTTAIGTSVDQWHLANNLEINTDRLPILLQKTGLTDLPSSAWLDTVLSLKGAVSLQLTSEVSDQIKGVDDFKQLRASLQSTRLSLTLPKDVLGSTIIAEIATTNPIQMALNSIAPLSVAAVEGDIQFSIGQPTALPPADTPAPLLAGNIRLSTESGVPQVLFKGQTKLGEATKLWETEKWQSLREKIPATSFHGTQSFVGEFSLPGIDGLVAQTAAPELRNFVTEIKLLDDAGINLDLPKEDNPLQALGWKKLHLGIQGGSSVKVTALKIPGEIDLAISQLGFSIHEISRSPAQVYVKGTDQPVLKGALHNTHCSSLPEIRCTAKLEASLPHLSMTDLKASAQDATLAVGKIDLNATDNDSLALSLNELNLTAKRVSSGEITLRNPELFAQQLRCEQGDGALTCDSPQVALSLAPLQSGDNQLRGVVFLEQLTLSRHKDTPQDIQAEASFHGENLNLRALNQYSSNLAARGQLKFGNQTLSGNSAISTGPIIMSTVWQHDLTNGNGRLTVELPQTAFSTSNTLGSAITGLPVDIVDGSVQADATLHWPNSAKDRLHVILVDTAVQYDSSFAVGINSNVALTPVNGQWITSQAVPVSIEALDTGVALKNLNFLLSLSDTGDLTLNNFAAELLEGALTSENLAWNIHGKERESNLQFTGLSIGALAREMESTNFAASGLLDAQIPITTDKQGVTVQAGSVQSRPPGGRLRYYGAFSPSMLGSNPQLKLLAGALEDYNYRDIRGTINYPLSGDLQLNLKLTGRSTAIDANRDLIINLNLENNVPSMLRSLQASRDLTDVLEKQVQ